MRTSFRASALVLALLAPACGGDDSDGTQPTYDTALLAQYRAALPKASQLSAATPQADGGARAIGEPAVYPPFGRQMALAVNGVVGWTVDTLERIVEVPPTVYNSETKEFFWGPWKNDNVRDNYGYVGAYIRENPAGDDFQFSYALLRGDSNDVASLVPVIWGGSTPDPDNEDYGKGVTMYDFEANYAFAQRDAAFVDQGYTRGRFVAFYGRDVADDNPDASFTFNVAVFANFLPEDAAPGTAAFDAEYFYGKYATTEHEIAFLDFSAGLDVSEPKDGIPEDLNIRMAFFDRGLGRAEVTSVPQDEGAQTISGVECWGPALHETYLSISGSGGTAEPWSASVGALANCGDTFGNSLDTLGIPSLATVEENQPGMLDKMHEVAETGIPSK